MIQVLSNINFSESVLNFRFKYFSSNHNCISLFLFLYRYRFYDYLIFNGSGRLIFYILTLKIIFPFFNFKIISLDLLLPEPKTFLDKFKLFIRSFLLSRVEFFLHYYKQVHGICNTYNLSLDKFYFVPFKINHIEKVLQVNPCENDYVFCGGKTRRDFDTLINVAKDIDIPIKIVTMENQNIMEHGSYLDDTEIPSNIDTIRLDGSFEPFLKYLSEAKLVVLPLIPHICGTGIGVYLMAMALNKCVIISDDASVQGVLENGEAILIPPQDPLALKDAITSAYYDDAYRKQIAANGHSYAMTLGGEDELYDRILKIIIDYHCLKTIVKSLY